jgi:hypothetical protein
MAIGSRRSRDRRQRARRFLFRAAKWVLVLAVFVGLGLWSYQTGLELARAEVAALQRRLDALAADTRALHATNVRLEGELRQAREDHAALQRRYEQDVPRGAAAELFSLAQQRIAAGIPRERIEQALRDAAPILRCEGRGTSRRFAIAYGPRPPEGPGFELHDGLVRVSVSARSQADDLSRAATVVVAVAGQDPVTLTGLPQRHPVLLGNAELTLSVSSEIRGFATVALSGC